MCHWYVLPLNKVCEQKKLALEDIEQQASQPVLLTSHEIRKRRLDLGMSFELDRAGTITRRSEYFESG